MALPLIFYSNPVDAWLGIVLGGLAYKVNHEIHKRKFLIMPVSAILKVSIGGMAILLWWKMSITMNGFPERWQDIPILHIF